MMSDTASLPQIAQTMPTVSAKPRLDWPDCYRGLAIVFIVAGHTGKMLTVAGINLRSFADAIYDLQIVGFAAFFAISGMNSRKYIGGDARAFWGGRVYPLFYLLLLWTLITAAIAAATQGRVIGIVEAAKAVSAALLHPMTHLWFVWSLLAYSLAARLAMNRWPRVSLAVTLLIVVAALCLDFDFYRRHPVPGIGSHIFMVRRALGYMFFFFLGYRYREQLIAIARGPIWSTAIGTGVVASILIWIANRMPSNLIGAPMRLAALFLGLVSTIYLGRVLASLPIVRPVFLWLGRFTLPVYLIHIPVLIIAIHLLAPAGDPFLRQHVPLLVAGLVVLGLVGGLVGAFLIARLRLIWLLRPPLPALRRSSVRPAGQSAPA
jgi:peptidoglycan/LPS O-acetylase OafA/YrhL